jgi:trk system potassium uptake protein TrkA
LASSKDPVLIVGLGRFGLSLARGLTAVGTPVFAVDDDMEAVQHASFTVPNVMQANCTDIDALRQIGAQDFTRAVVAIGSDIEASILAVSLLSDLGIPDIWAKASTTQHARILGRVGATHVVQPERDTGERVAHQIAHRLLDYVEIDPQWVLARVKPPQDLVGVPLGGTKVRKQRGITVVSVKPQGSANFTYCDAQTVLNYGDEILIMGTPHDVDRFSE